MKGGRTPVGEVGNGGILKGGLRKNERTRTRRRGEQSKREEGKQEGTSEREREGGDRNIKVKKKTRTFKYSM